MARLNDRVGLRERSARTHFHSNRVRRPRLTSTKKYRGQRTSRVVTGSCVSRPNSNGRTKDDALALRCFAAAVRRGLSGRSAIRIAHKQYSILKIGHELDLYSASELIRDSESLSPQVSKSDSLVVRAVSPDSSTTSRGSSKHEDESRAEAILKEVEDNEELKLGEIVLDLGETDEEYDGPALRTRDRKKLLSAPFMERRRRQRPLRQSQRRIDDQFYDGPDEDLSDSEDCLSTRESRCRAISITSSDSDESESDAESCGTTTRMTLRPRAVREPNFSYSDEQTCEVVVNGH